MAKILLVSRMIAWREKPQTNMRGEQGGEAAQALFAAAAADQPE